MKKLVWSITTDRTHGQIVARARYAGQRIEERYSSAMQFMDVLTELEEIAWGLGRVPQWRDTRGFHEYWRYPNYSVTALNADLMGVAVNTDRLSYC